MEIAHLDAFEYPAALRLIEDAAGKAIADEANHRVMHGKFACAGVKWEYQIRQYLRKREERRLAEIKLDSAAIGPLYKLRFGE